VAGFSALGACWTKQREARGAAAPHFFSVLKLWPEHKAKGCTGHPKATQGLL